MKQIKIIFPLLLMMLMHSCKNNIYKSNLYNGYEFERFHYELSVNNLDYYYKKMVYDSITLIFRKTFNDEVEIFINNKRYKSLSLYSDTLSTEVPFNAIKIYNKSGQNRILLRLVKKKKMIEFCIDQRIPFYEISRYNNIWYINRYSSVVTKVIKKEKK